MSNRDAAMDIISIAQQANPNPSGQIELRRAQFTALSSCVKMIPSSCSSLPKSSGFVSVTCFARVVSMVPRLPHYIRTSFQPAQSAHSELSSRNALATYFLHGILRVRRNHPSLPRSFAEPGDAKLLDTMDS